jgi:hypothetical protein
MPETNYIEKRHLGRTDMTMGPDDHLVETIKNVLWKDEELLG